MPDGGFSGSQAAVVEPGTDGVPMRNLGAG